MKNAGRNFPLCQNRQGILVCAQLPVIESYAKIAPAHRLRAIQQFDCLFRRHKVPQRPHVTQMLGEGGTSVRRHIVIHHRNEAVRRLFRTSPERAAPHDGGTDRRLFTELLGPVRHIICSGSGDRQFHWCRLPLGRKVCNPGHLGCGQHHKSRVVRKISSPQPARL